MLILNSQKVAFLENPRLVIALTKEELNEEINNISQQIHEISKQLIENSDAPNKDELFSKREILRKRRRDLIDFLETRKTLPKLTPPAGNIEKMYKRFQPDPSESLGLISPDKLISYINDAMKYNPNEEIKNELNEMLSYINLIKEEIGRAISDIKGKYQEILSKYSNRINQIMQELTPRAQEEILE